MLTTPTLKGIQNMQDGDSLSKPLINKHKSFYKDSFKVQNTSIIFEEHKLLSIL